MLTGVNVYKRRQEKGMGSLPKGASEHRIWLWGYRCSSKPQSSVRSHCPMIKFYRPVNYWGAETEGGGYVRPRIQWLDEPAGLRGDVPHWDQLLNPCPRNHGLCRSIEAATTSGLASVPLSNPEDHSYWSKLQGFYSPRQSELASWHWFF